MGFNCAEHKWQHLLNPCPICSYKYSADDTASETNQNDTQDEAEQKAWELECSKAWVSKTPEEFHEYIFKQGYRAGVASVADKHLELVLKYVADKNLELAVTHSDLAEKSYALREQLAAEKARSKKLLAAMNKIAILGRSEMAYTSDFTEAVNMISREQCANYSTDSGDGSGK